jgi:hypothetical protein
VLFPRLRPGGKYVIEDWAWAHAQLGGEPGPAFWPEEIPLTTMVFEAVMAVPQERGIIADVHVVPDYIVITRGSGDATGFDIRSAYDERGRELVIPLRPG